MGQAWGKPGVPASHTHLILRGLSEPQNVQGALQRFLCLVSLHEIASVWVRARVYLVGQMTLLRDSLQVRQSSGHLICIGAFLSEDFRCEREGFAGPPECVLYVTKHKSKRQKGNMNLHFGNHLGL